MATYKELVSRMQDALLLGQADEYESLSKEQEHLLVFQPLMTHSFNEAKGIIRFHIQILNDFSTVEEIALKVLDQLHRASQ